MNKHLIKIIHTTDDYAPTLARLTLGLVMFPHGAQKMLGMFGGYGFTGTMGYFTSQGMPYAVALLPIFAEFFGSLGLMSGILTRVAAFGITCTMLVAMLTVHLTNGFFINWSGQQQGEGIEFFLLAIGLGVLIMLRGGGALSGDLMMTNKCKK